MKLLKFIPILIAIPFIVYVGVRAVTAGLTHDESFTYLYFVNGTYFHPLVFLSHSNNHFLNTIGMFISDLVIPGFQVWALRIPSLIGFGLYLFYGWKNLEVLGLGKQVKYPIYLFLLANPFLLEFFGLARGYSLGIGLTMMGVYYLQRYLQSDRQAKDTLRNALIAFSLAVFSNFSFLYIWLAANLIVGWPWLKQIRDWRKLWNLVQFKLYLLINVVTVGIFAVPFLAMWYRKQFYFGGAVGFWEDTVRSVIANAFYTQSGNFPVVEAFVAIVIFLSVAALTYFLTKGWAGLTWIRLSVICVVGQLATFYILHSLLPIERAALLFYPLFWMSVAELVSIYKDKVWNWLVGTALLAGALVYIYLNLPNYNLHSTLIWKYDACTQTAYQELRKLNPKTAGINWTIYFSMEIYRQTSGHAELNLTKIEDPVFGDKLPEADAYYLPSSINPTNAKLIKSFDECGYSLYE